MIRLLAILPTILLSRLTGRLARLRWPKFVKNMMIRILVRSYGVIVDEAEEPPLSYPSLLDFFIRRLKPGARLVDPAPDAIVSPVDARWMDAGPADAAAIIAVKGSLFTIADLLGDTGAAQRYAGGQFVVLHLRPGDYHRVHVPAGGRVIGHHWIGGRLLPVTEASYRIFGPILKRNQRRVTIIQAPWGIYALVMVGAFNVSGMPVNYTPAPPSVRVMPVPGEPAFATGAELGRFELGSTVVLLFPPGRVRLEPPADERVRVGKRIGTVLK
ncbi:MAG: archaetidylserine decarboxylase [Planctomycetota bacterium]